MASRSSYGASTLGGIELATEPTPATTVTITNPTIYTRLQPFTDTINCTWDAPAQRMWRARLYNAARTVALVDGPDTYDTTTRNRTFTHAFATGTGYAVGVRIIDGDGIDSDEQVVAFGVLPVLPTYTKVELIPVIASRIYGGALYGSGTYGEAAANASTGGLWGGALYGTGTYGPGTANPIPDYELVAIPLRETPTT